VDKTWMDFLYVKRKNLDSSPFELRMTGERIFVILSDSEESLTIKKLELNVAETFRFPIKKNGRLKPSAT